MTKWPLDIARRNRRLEVGHEKHSVAVGMLAEIIIKDSNKDSTENEVPTPEVAMSMTQANSKIHEPGSYDEAIRGN